MVFNLFMGILRTNIIKSTMTLDLVAFVLLKQKSSISMKASRDFVSCLLSGLCVLYSSNRNESSTESKSRISFIVIPLDLVMSICRCTNPNSFFIALMLAFPVSDYCGRALNFGRFTFVIVALSFSDFSTKRSLRKFFYYSFPSSTKAK